MKVNVGCGKNPLPGWVNLDNSPSIVLARIPFLPDVLRRVGMIGDSQLNFMRFARRHRVVHADAAKRFPFPDGSVEVLYSSHMIEHLDRKAARRFLHEAVRILRPGGIIRLAIPDLRQQVEDYVRTGDADRLVERTMLAIPEHDGFRGRLSLLLFGPRNHRWMYDGPSLARFMEGAGFVKSTILAAGMTRIPEPGNLDLYERSAETVYVEAEKP